MNLLFLSGGRRVELLRAFRRAYEAEGMEGRIVAADMEPLAPALRVADHEKVVVPAAEGVETGTAVVTVGDAEGTATDPEGLMQTVADLVE